MKLHAILSWTNRKSQRLDSKVLFGQFAYCLHCHFVSSCRLGGSKSIHLGEVNQYKVQTKEILTISPPILEAGLGGGGAWGLGIGYFYEIVMSPDGTSVLYLTCWNLSMSYFYVNISHAHGQK